MGPASTPLNLLHVTLPQVDVDVAQRYDVVLYRRHVLSKLEDQPQTLLCVNYTVSLYIVHLHGCLVNDCKRQRYSVSFTHVLYLQAPATPLATLLLQLWSRVEQGRENL
ncbi:MAG: hypothetical protein NZ954_08230 [Thermofilaceae archaeon]|nr:hypothetical protein [Thermofilaceae archaeon]